MRLRLLVLYILTLATICVSAQESVITVSRDSRLSKEEQLEGKGAVVFRSNSEDLVISTPVKTDPICLSNNQCLNIDTLKANGDP